MTDGIAENLLRLVQTAHKLVAATDQLASQIADAVNVDPSDDLITDVIWNMVDADYATETLLMAALSAASQGDAPAGTGDPEAHQ